MTPLMLQQQLLLLLRKGSITKQKFIALKIETKLSCCSPAQQNELCHQLETHLKKPDMKYVSILIKLKQEYQHVDFQCIGLTFSYIFTKFNIVII